MDRRFFLLGSASLLAARAALAADSKSSKSTKTTSAGTAPAATPPAPTAPTSAAPAPAPFTLPPLPYAQDALAPTISANTLSFHYDKHHKTYVDNLNNFVQGTEYASMKLEDVIKASLAADKKAIFNNAAQMSHHTFYWNSMKPGGGGTPAAGPLLDAINKDFGDFSKFRTQFIDDATRLFGSGWCWLVLDGGVLKTAKTSNADLPAGKPLLVIDVWEHAYYLDYMNKRKDYVNGWFDKLANWSFAEANLKA